MTTPPSPRAPDIRSCEYVSMIGRHGEPPADGAFLVEFADGRSALLAPTSLRFLPKGAEIASCVVVHGGSGVEVTLGDGSMTDFSGDFVMYETDPEFRQQADDATRARREWVVRHHIGAALRLLLVEQRFTIRFDEDDWGITLVTAKGEPMVPEEFRPGTPTRLAIDLIDELVSEEDS